MCCRPVVHVEDLTRNAAARRTFRPAARSTVCYPTLQQAQEVRTQNGLARTSRTRAFIWGSCRRSPSWRSRASTHSTPRSAPGTGRTSTAPGRSRRPHRDDPCADTAELRPRGTAPVPATAIRACDAAPCLLLDPHPGREDCEGLRPLLSKDAVGGEQGALVASRCMEHGIKQILHD